MRWRWMFDTKNLTGIAAFLLLATAIPAQSSPGYANVWDAVLIRTDVTCIKQLAVNAGLDKVWSDGTLQITVFLPTDAAFDKLAESLGLSNVTSLLNNSTYAASLNKLPSYYTVNSNLTFQPQMLSAGDSGSEVSLQTQLGNATFQSLKVVTTSSAVKVVATSSSANVTEMDISAGAGYVNIVDDVLQFWYDNTDNALAANNLTYSSAALQSKNLSAMFEALGFRQNVPYVLFAPTDEAWQASDTRLVYDSDFLKYHVLLLLSANFSSIGTKAYTTTLLTYGSSDYNVPRLYVNSYGNGAMTVSNVDNSTVANSLSTIPVGISSTVTVVMLDQVLNPTYATAWRALQSISYLSGAAGAFQANAVLKAKLMSPNAAFTLFVPTNDAIRTYLQQKYGKDTDDLYGTVPSADLYMILYQWVVEDIGLAYTSMFNRISTWKTMYPSSNLTISGSSTTVLVKADSGTLCTVNAEALVNLGRSTIFTTAGVLLPPSGNPGSASAAAPSLWMAAVLALIGSRLVNWLLV